MPSKPKRKPMSDTHKKALAEGRAQGRAVRRYLEHIDSSNRRGGRRRSPEDLQRQLDEIDRRLDGAKALDRLSLLQKRADIETELETAQSVEDGSALEQDFQAHAKAYAERKGITYSTWRAAGVPASVLREAGITRSS